MKQTYDLSTLDWTVSGWTPFHWTMPRSMEVGALPNAEVPAVPASVPGSVQEALRRQGLLPDWNSGRNALQCEWVENRHWIYEAAIPDEWLEAGGTVRLRCDGLDYKGWVYVNDSLAGEFEGSFVPHVFDLTGHLAESGNVLRIVFDLPPRWLGQFGYTSRMTDWKVRYNYTWDWTVRLVQVGIWDSVTLEVTDGRELLDVRAYTETDGAAAAGRVHAWGTVPVADGCSVRVEVTREGAVCSSRLMPAEQFCGEGLATESFGVDLWQPNGQGEQPLYALSVTLIDSAGSTLDTVSRTIGFREVRWEPCEGAPPEADPWICSVNERRIFLQGANWVPLLPNFADVTEDDYSRHLELYRDLGFNILRVWGGAVLERECFYRLCDEMGLMVWQEFPLSSSGRENRPPSDSESIRAHEEIARSYIAHRQHHPSLIIWCGGNELQDDGGVPCDLSYPLLRRQSEVVLEMDPDRRYLATSSSGPHFYADPKRFGEGVHWDVHGPWKADGDLAAWESYWERDDALFRSETGAPGTSSADIIRQHAGDCEVMPATPANPLWRRTSVWWIEREQFVREHSREPESLEEYVAWSQTRQARALKAAAAACKKRFPRCGGFIVWMGHDCFPCTANTSVIDFHCRPKPAAVALADVFKADR